MSQATNLRIAGARQNAGDFLALAAAITLSMGMTLSPRYAAPRLVMDSPSNTTIGRLH
jgi:drug/metabolite transporter (DMT)-like permease